MVNCGFLRTGRNPSWPSPSSRSHGTRFPTTPALGPCAHATGGYLERGAFEREQLMGAVTCRGSKRLRAS